MPKLDVPLAAPPRRLEHIDGTRFLATLWIVVGHFEELPAAHRGAFGRLLSRGHVAVGFYIVLSGFITQWAFGRRALLEEGRGAVGAFLLRRRCGRRRLWRAPERLTSHAPWPRAGD